MISNRYRIVCLILLSFLFGYCKNQSGNNSTVSSNTTVSYLDSLPKGVRRMAITCYPDYVKRLKEKRPIDSIYGIWLYRYTDYLELRWIIPQCTQLHSINFLWYKAPLPSTDSIIDLVNKCKNLKSVYFFSKALPANIKRNSLSSIFISLDTVENGCNFSACDSLESLRLAAWKWKNSEKDSFKFPSTLKGLNIYGVNINLKFFIQNASAPHLQKLTIADSTLDNIPDNIKKFRHLQLLDIAMGTKLGKEITDDKPSALAKLKRLKHILPRNCEIHTHNFPPPCGGIIL